MRCQEALSELDAYMTGELSRTASLELERHARDCPACAAEMQALEKERLLYRDYAALAGTPRITWSEIRNDIILKRVSAGAKGPEERARSGGRRLLLAAASLLLVSSLSFYLYRFGLPESKRPGETDKSAELEFHVNRALIDFEQALALLNQIYRDKKSELDPGVVATLDRNLQVLDMAIHECKRALRQHPNDPRPIEFLVLAYQKKIDALKQITGDQ